MDVQPSDTYKKLYYQIIDEIFYVICNDKNNDLCIKSPTIQYRIWNKFYEYWNKTLEHMSGERLDRHKLASCICGAIIEVKPLVHAGKETKKTRANEILAMHVGLNVIKAFMIEELLKDSEGKNSIEYLKSSWEMQFPKNICDIQEYPKNFVNALCWSHSKCNSLNKECFHYDIWAYSKLFYHLELYNDPLLKQCYEDYLQVSSC